MNKDKEILITGGRGMVGQYFEIYPNCYITHKDELDVTDRKGVRDFVQKLKPKTIIHLAAETDVDLCERNPELAYRVNAEGAENVAYASSEIECLLVYLSSAGIFSGEGSKPYRVGDKPCPVNVYAKSKLMGEKLVEELASRHLVVRTGWIFGGFDKDRKFVSLIANQIWNGVRVIRAIDDILGCPTYGKDLASAILAQIKNLDGSIAHVVNQGFASRFEIASEIARVLDPAVQVEAAKSTDFPSFNARRPKFEVIEPTVSLRPWQNALQEYLLEWQAMKALDKFKSLSE